MVSDFRKDHGKALDELLNVRIARPMAVGVVKLEPVAQDGLRGAVVPERARFVARKNSIATGGGACGRAAAES